MAVDLWKRRVPLTWQNRVIEGRLAARHLVDGNRRLPELLVIGAQRAGTSSLYKWLESHPNVVASLRKETEYLSAHWCKPESWYRGHFASGPRRTFEKALRARPIVTFEASPNYLFHPLAPERAAGLMPDARIVALLRDPVDRAFSHWQHEVRNGRESLGFEAALDAEPDRLAGEEDRMRADHCYRSLAWERCSYAARGRYADQLQRWFALFPRGQVMVVHSADLYRDTASCYAAILDFLRLPAFTPKAFGNHSFGGGAPRGTRMADATWRRLKAEFAPHDQRLYELLGCDFGWDD